MLLRPWRATLVGALFFIQSFAGVLAWANTCERYLVVADAIPTPESHYALDRGSHVKFQAGEGAQVDAIFLGRLVAIDNTTTDVAFYEPTNQVVHVVPWDKVSITRAGGEELPAKDVVAIVRSVNQEGGTCAAYSIYNCMRQMRHWGHHGNGALAQKLSSEAGRLSLLVSTVNHLYIENQPAVSVLGSLVNAYGFKNYAISYDKPDELKSSLVKHLRQGWPVLITFDTPTTMSTAPYSIIEHGGDEKPLDPRLWKPKGRFRFRKSAHMVLVLGAFEVNGETKLLISDPNWQVPRLWDLSDLDNARAASVQAFVIWDEKNSTAP